DADETDPAGATDPQVGPADSAQAAAADASATAAAAPASTAAAAMAQAAATEVRGSPQTVANMAAQIVNKLNARSSQFDVQLNPAGLGKVDVRMTIGADGKMSASMSFDTPQAAAELKARAGELQQAMEQSGFDLSGGMSFDVASDSGQGGQAQNQPQPDAGAVFRGRAFQAALDTTADVAPQLSLRRSATSGVDIRI
ncbi:flagellar hook-length control protein FliK, partial [Phenylobacterium sp.]|uniref:flagellar hook-length control protein FliK n=1 Tax=Phenylobacterium sp. TaxID=1871053 RepID=UPI00120FBEC7